MNMSRDDIKLVTVCYHSLYKMFGKDIPDVITNRLNEELRIVISNGEADAYCMLWWIFAHCTDVMYRGTDLMYSGLKANLNYFILYLFGLTDVNPCPELLYCTNCGYIVYRQNDMEGPLYQYLDYCPDCGEPYDDLSYYDGCDLPINKTKSVDDNRAKLLLSVIADIMKEKDILCSLSDKEVYSLSRALSICDIGGIETIRMVVDYLVLDKVLDGKLEEYVDERYA